MQSKQCERALLAILDGLEAELRRVQLWDPESPSKKSLTSSQPFCIDTLALPQWLQWLLIPRMRTILADECPMPTHSAIYPLAEDSFKGLDDSRTLLALIEQFDQLITKDVAVTVH